MKNLAVQKTFLLLTIHELLALSFLSQILNTDTFPVIQSYLLIYFFDMLGYFSQQMNWFMPFISSTGIFYTQMLTYKLLFCYTMPLSFSHHSCFSLCSLTVIFQQLIYLKIGWDLNVATEYMYFLEVNEGQHCGAKVLSFSTSLM